MTLQIKHLRLLNATHGHIFARSPEPSVVQAGRELEGFLRHYDTTKETTLTHITDRLSKVRLDEVNVEHYL